MSKKKAPALHERRGREDISTRPPRLAGYPIKLAGNARLHRLSLAADSCVNRKYYGGDPGVGQRKTGLHTIPPSGTLRRRPGARFSLGQVLGSHEGHIKWPSARAELAINLMPRPSGATREPPLSYPPAFRKSKCQKIRFFDSVLYNPPFVGTIQRVRKQKGLIRVV